jgi:hypothetical protein
MFLNVSCLTKDRKQEIKNEQTKLWEIIEKVDHVGDSKSEASVKCVNSNLDRSSEVLVCINIHQ